MPPRILIALLLALVSLLHGSAPPAHLAAAAQRHGKGWSVTVLADRVEFGSPGQPPEAIPFVVDRWGNLDVPAGQTFTLGPAAAYAEIRQAGTIRCSDDYDTRLRYVTWIRLPGAVFECGTEQAPLRRNVRIDHVGQPLMAGDSFQWRNGIVNFGIERMHGAPKTAATTLAEDAPAGASTVTVVNSDGWNVGDRIVIADMRDARGHAPVPYFGVLTARTGTTWSLDTPLAIPYAGIRGADGKVVAMPVVANLTRNITLRTLMPLAPNAVPPHTASIGEHASSDIRYVAFENLGRTRALTLGPDHLPGKYCDHAHHMPAGSFVRIGNAYSGDRSSKWAVAVHDTDGALIENNVCTNFSGACFAIEDPESQHGVMRGNTAILVAGGNAIEHPVNLQQNNPGSEDSGFWLNGIRGWTIEDNVAANTRRGFIFDGDQFDPAEIPKVDRGNKAFANTRSGIEFWNNQPWDMAEIVAAHNGETQVWPAGVGGNARLINPLLIGGGSRLCIESSTYTPSVEILGGYVGGCELGLTQIGRRVSIVGTRMQNRVNIDMEIVPAEVLIQDVAHLPLPGGQPQIKLILGPPAGGTQRKQLALTRNGGSRIRILNWDNTGQDYYGFTADQRRSTPATDWTASGGFWEITPGLPAELQTLGEAWDTFGMCPYGECVDDAQLLQFPGVVNGYFRLGSASPLGPPREVLTYPNLLSVPLVETNGANKYVTFNFTRTGDPAGTTARSCFTLNGGAVECRVLDGGGFSGDDFSRRLLVPVSALVPGTNTVKTYREMSNGARVGAMEFQFNYSGGRTDSSATVEGVRR